jgi:hypothetical protein
MMNSAISAHERIDDGEPSAHHTTAATMTPSERRRRPAPEVRRPHVQALLGIPLEQPHGHGLAASPATAIASIGPPSVAQRRGR